MATDRDEFEDPCPCGKGTILVVHETPDHSWASGQWSRWSTSLQCDECSKLYAFVGRKLVARADAERLDQAKAKLEQAETEARQMPVVQTIRDALARRLDAMTSKAARHRWLAENQLDHSTYGTFIRHWRSGAQTAAHVASTESLIQAARVCGVPFDELVAKQAEIDRLKADVWIDIPAVKTGNPHLEA